MSGFLFPRLRSGHAQLWADRFKECRPIEIAEQLPLMTLEGLRYAPTGGSRVSPDILAQFREDVIEGATACGYPDQRSNQGQREFDLAAARLLIELPMITGEASRDEVWQYFTCVLVPDLVAWRFGKTDAGAVKGPTSPARFLGGGRNMLQRMWWRATILRDPTAEDELWLLDTDRNGLTEDNMVALLERGNIAWYNELCRVIAVEFVRHRSYVKECGESPEQTLLREVMKKVVRLAAHSNPEAIPAHERLGLVRELFVETVEELGGEAPAPGRIYSSMAVQHLENRDVRAEGIRDLRGGAQMQALFGGQPRQVRCRLKWYWADGTVRSDTRPAIRWYDAGGADDGKSDWRLAWDRDVSLKGAKEGDIVIIAKTARDGELELFVLPQEARMALRIRGALDSRGRGVDMPDDVEKYVRDELFAQL